MNSVSNFQALVEKLPESAKDALYTLASLVYQATSTPKELGIGDLRKDVERIGFATNSPVDDFQDTCEDLEQIFQQQDIEEFDDDQPEIQQKPSKGKAPKKEKPSKGSEKVDSNYVEGSLATNVDLGDNWNTDKVYNYQNAMRYLNDMGLWKVVPTQHRTEVIKKVIYYRDSYVNKDFKTMIDQTFYKVPDWAKNSTPTTKDKKGNEIHKPLSKALAVSAYLLGFYDVYE